MHRLSLKQIHLNSDARGILDFEQKEGKVWQARELISPTFVDGCPSFRSSGSRNCPLCMPLIIHHEVLDLTIHQEVLDV